MSLRFAAGLVLCCLLVESCRPARGEAPATPKATPAPRTDRYGDPLPEGAIARLGTIRFRSGAQVFSVAYSPDGRLLATSGYDGTVCVWRTADGKEVFRILTPRTAVHGAPDIEFSPDGKLLGVGRGGDISVGLWDTTTGKARTSLSTANGENASAIAFSPDGNALAAICWIQKGRDRQIRIRMWNLKKGNEVKGFASPDGRSWSIAFAPDSKSMVVGQEGAICVCDAASGRKVHTLQRSNSHYAVVAFSADGTIASAAQDEKVIRLWDAATGREKRVLRGHTEMISSLHFSRDGKRLISSAALNGVCIWDVAEGKIVRRLRKAVALDKHSIALSPNGKTLAVGSGGFALIRWDLETGKETADKPGHAVPVNCLAFTPDGRVVSSGFGGDIRVWNASSGKQISLMKEKEDQLNRFALSPDGRIVACGLHNGLIYFRDLNTGKEIAKLSSDGGDAPYPAFAPDGKTLAVRYLTWPKDISRAILLWDVASGKARQQIQPASERIGPVLFSPDGKKLASLSSSIQLWDAPEGKELPSFRMGQVRGADAGIRFSPDGERLAAPCYPSGFAVWDVTTRNLEYRGGGKAARSVAFAPDGRLFACGKDDGTIELWEVLTWTLLGKWQGPNGRILALAFSNNGRLLASGHEDTTTLIWDVPSLWSPAMREAALTKERLDALWTQLGSDQAKEGYRAIAVLSQAPAETLPLLRKHVRPARAGDTPSVARLIADLDSEDFKVREKATEELAARGSAVRAALRAALADNPSAEAKRRMQGILEKLPTKSPHELLTADERRDLRAIAVLEQIATPEARQVLEELAKGASDAALTRQARSAKERLRRQTAREVPQLPHP